MIQRLELLPTHQMLLDRIAEERTRLDSVEAKAIRSMLTEVGGRLDQPWQFNRDLRLFWMDVPDTEHQIDATTANADASGT